jgi:serine/threonine protein kinase
MNVRITDTIPLEQILCAVISESCRAHMTLFVFVFHNLGMADVKKNILSGSFNFEPADIWEQVSPLAKRFVTRLLNTDPNKRPTAKEVQRDEWLQVYGRKSSSEGDKLSPRIVEALVNFKEYSQMRRLLHEVLSFTLLPGRSSIQSNAFKPMHSIQWL